MMITRTKLLLLTLITTLMLSATALAQNENGQISFTSTELTVKESLEQIMAQTVYLFTFNGRQLDLDRTVTFDSAQLELNDALRQIIAGTNLTYIQQAKYIVFRPAPAQARPPKPVPALPVVSPYGESYMANEATNLATSRRRPLASPVITIAHETLVIADTVRSQNTESYSSFIVPVGSYANHPMPRYALKINALYGLATLTPNIAFEIATGPRTTLELSASYNGWNLSGSHESNKKLVHMILRPEFRWWMCERFNGHFLGAHVFYARYNIGTHNIPLLFEKEHRYDGHAYGAGFTYGYHMMLSRHWGIEFNIGLGAAYLDYDRFNCAVCDNAPVAENKWYFGPTRAGITAIFNF